MVFPILGAIGGALFGSTAATAATIGAVGTIASTVYAGKQQKKAQQAANRANAEAQQAQNQFNLEQADPAEIRKKFESAGFNPILGVSNWQPVQQTGYVPQQPAFSTGISEAGAVFGNFFDGIAKEKSALTAAQQENAKLKERLRDQMLRPTVGGIFGGGDRPLAAVSAALSPTGSPLTSAQTAANPLSRFVLAGGEVPEHKAMESASFWKQLRGLGDAAYPIYTPAEPDLDEFLMTMAFALPQMGRNAVTGIMDRTAEYSLGSKETRAKMRREAIGNMPSLSAYGLVSGAARLMGATQSKNK